jgi:hypothetical protein
MMIGGASFPSPFMHDPIIRILTLTIPSHCIPRLSSKLISVVLLAK